MAKFKVGDQITVIAHTGTVYLNHEFIGSKHKIHHIDERSRYPFKIAQGGDNGFMEEDIELISELKKTNTTFMSSLKQKFSILFKSEPQKSFIKAGIIDSEENITSEGKDVFLTWLLKENQEAFNKAVVQPLLKQEEEDNK